MVMSLWLDCVNIYYSSNNNNKIYILQHCHGDVVAVSVNRRSSEIQGTALGKCLQAWPVYIGPCLRV